MCGWVKRVNNENEVPQNILLTGKPGCGKTTLIEKVIKRLSCPVCGFLTREIRQGRSRFGFKIEDLNGRKDLLATKSFRSKFRVGSYRVNVEAVDRIAVSAIEEGLGKKTVIVIDEIASMELLSQRFRNAVLAALDAPYPVVASIQMKSSPFLDKLRLRGDILLFYISSGNREALVNKVSQLVNSAYESASARTG